MQNRLHHPSLPPTPQPLYQPSFSSHYAQAYQQAYSQPQPHTPYLIVNSPNLQPFQPPAAWYQPGNSRCTYKACTFSGSQKALETHMMDRHLIYPPGWDKRSKKSEWDADPSLKGKPIPIQGTNLILDKPEDLEAWLAERKRRWPTADRVDEKKRKTEEALSRGQLPDTLGRRPNKRQRTGESGSERGRGRERGRGQPSRGRGARPTDSGWQGRAPKTVPSQDLHALSTLSSTSQAPVAGSISDDNSEDEDEGSPEVISSKAPVDPLPSVTDCNSFTTTETAGPKRNSVADRQFKRPPPQPRKEVFNPFASRPTLLRNLLIPEIRMTISNLSQAIRFLVDNDFLEGVEGTPGDADCKMIQVIDEESTKE